jgi:hypothetical protein
MARPWQPTLRLAACALFAAVLVACTGSAADTDGETGTTGSVDTGPTPAQTFTPGVAVYTYENAELEVVVDIRGSDATLHVDNGTEQDLDEPDLYVLDALDGHEIDVRVVDATPVGAGERATFDVDLGEVEVDRIGLLVLLFGRDNYGAFVRTG